MMDTEIEYRATFEYRLIRPDGTVLFKGIDQAYGGKLPRQGNPLRVVDQAYLLPGHPDPIEAPWRYEVRWVGEAEGGWEFATESVLSQPPEVLTGIYVEAIAENRRQRTIHGDQAHLPSLDQTLLNRPGGCTPERMAEEYGIPSARIARSRVDALAQRGELTWGHIATEEFAEIFDCLTDEAAMRAEIIQTMAVLGAWVAAIDKRAATAVQSPGEAPGEDPR